jgi:hypothetical protein
VIKVDIGNLCTHCSRDTSFGSGLFVDRIPSGADGRLLLANNTGLDVSVEGYMCHECQRVECDKCDKPTLDYHMVDGSVFCSDCFKVIWGHALEDCEHGYIRRTCTECNDDK